MRPIVLTRAAYLNVYTEVLREIGAPVDRELSSFGLPTALDDQPDAYVPVGSCIHFIERMERSEGIKDLAFLASQAVTYGGLGPDFHRMACGASTLGDELRLLCRLIYLEDSALHAWLEHGRGSVRICSDFRAAIARKHLRYAEWLQNAAVISIIRRFAGPRWTPPVIAFRSTFDPDPGAIETYPNCRFRFGQDAAYIEVPASLLSLALKRGPSGETDPNAPIVSPAPPPPESEFDFPGSLKMALRGYLGDSHPGIGLAAEIAGTSVRTLQRQLAQFGLSYSDLVQQARFESATELLSDQDTKIIDVAMAVGYDDASHFSRAFRRLAGVTSREYRQNMMQT